MRHTYRIARRITLEDPVRQPDGAGGFATAWTELGALWADIDPGSARLATPPGARESRVPLRITVRGAPPGAPSRPRPGQRFRDRGRTYAIQSVADSDPRGRFLLCLAHEEGAL